MTRKPTLNSKYQENLSAEESKLAYGFRFNNHEKRWEQKGIFCLSKCYLYQNPDLITDRETMRKTIIPMLDARHSNYAPDQMRAAFAIIGHLLNPESGPYRSLPQISPLWLAFRRLFLNLTKDAANLELDEPEDLRVQEFQGLNVPIYSESQKSTLIEELDPSLLDELGNPFQEWRKHFLPDLEILSSWAESRLFSYENANIRSIKSHLIDKDIFLGAECGFLNEVFISFKRNWLSVIDQREAIFSQKSRTTEGILREITAKNLSADLDFDMELSKALNSVRQVLFDISVETVLGSRTPNESDTWKLEKEFKFRHLVNNPYLLLSENQIAEYVADEMTYNGKHFASKLANHYEKRLNNADRNNQTSRIEVKKQLALLWINPNFPLWLMNSGAIESILKRFLPVRVTKFVTENSIREHWKTRASNKISSLYRMPKQLIVISKSPSERSGSGNRRSDNPIRIKTPNYLKDCSSFNELKSHCETLSLILES